MNRKQKFLVELTRARILVSNGQFEEAKPILEDMQHRRRVVMLGNEIKNFNFRVYGSIC